MPPGEDVGELGLESVRVLVFVYEHVQELLLQALAHRLLRLQELEPLHEEVVEVHRVELALASGVHDAYLRDRLGIDARRLRQPALGDGLDRARLVRGLGDDLGDHLLLREVLHVLHCRLDDVADELLLVVLVEDAEARGVPDEPGVAPEDARADRVERSGPDGRHGGPDDLLRPFEHLARRAVGEGEEEYPVCGAPLLDEERDAVHESARLAGAGRREDEQRSVARRRRRALFWIKQFREISHLAYYTKSARSAAHPPRKTKKGRLPAEPPFALRAALTRYFASAAVTSARTWRRAFGTRFAVAERTVVSFEALASYSS